MKPITRITITLLSGILVLLGFGACKSSKKVVKDKDEGEIIRDTVRPIIPNHRPANQDPTRMKVVYGPPSSTYREIK